MSDEQLEKLWKKVACLERKVDEIHTSQEDILKLLKTDQFGQPGLVTKIGVLKGEMAKAKRDIDRIYFTAFLIGALAGMVASMITVVL